MKIIFSGLLAVALFWACNQSSPKTSPVPQVGADSLAAAEAIHGFYKWYDAFSTQGGGINFTDDAGEHLKLDASKLDAYFKNFLQSGFVSNTFVENEKAFYKKCEALWQKEPKDDVPSCLDADKYFCAQDWDINFWTQSPVRIKSLGSDKLSATLYETGGDYPQERNFELVKENGKWVIAKIECDMGVE